MSVPTEQPRLHTIENVLQAHKDAEGLYHRLVFLVGEAGTGKTKTLQGVAANIGVELVNVNLELSRVLLEMTNKQRMLQLPKLLDDLAKGNADLVFDNTEILFDVDLQQDPLRLLKGISRNRNIVVSWNGSIENNKLIYAEPGHPEYRSYDATDLLTVVLKNTDI